MPYIKNMVFENQTPKEAMEQLKKLEEDFNENSLESDQIIDITEEYGNEIKPIIKFNDGHEWLNLNVPFCNKEGGAMGHCGNTASYNNNQTIFSLRKVIESKGKILSKPFLTFIYDKSNSSLGEMKGRANEKPAKRYHKYILALLKQKTEEGEFLIKHLLGGGYLPESNFRIADLSEEDQKDLYETRSDLMPIAYIFKTEGQEAALKALQEKLEPYNLQARSTAKYVARILLFKNLEEFVDSVVLPKGMENAYEYISGEQHMDYSPDEIGKYDLKYMYQDVIRHFPNFEKALESDGQSIDFEELYESDSPVIEVLTQASYIGNQLGAEEQLFEDFIDALEDVWQTEYYDTNLLYNRETGTIDGSFSLNDPSIDQFLLSLEEYPDEKLEKYGGDIRHRPADFSYESAYEYIKENLDPKYTK
jgi:hypothetical protein